MNDFDPSTILKQNFMYFKEDILPYIIIINTSLGDIVVDVTELNLKHLLGIDKTFNSHYKNMPPENFFIYLSNKDIDLFEIIDKMRYENSELTTEELHIYNKNHSFIEIFESLFNQVNIRFYRKKTGDNFDADYVHFSFINKSGGYIGIIGSEVNNYHYFNSIMLETNIPEKYKGASVMVNNIKRIKKENFNFKDYKFLVSRRLIRPKMSKKATRKATDIKMLVKNKSGLLNDNLKVVIGAYGKNSIQVYKNDCIVEKRFLIPDEFKYESIIEIAKYINDRFG